MKTTVQDVEVKVEEIIGWIIPRLKLRECDRALHNPPRFSKSQGQGITHPTRCYFVNVFRLMLEPETRNLCLPQGLEYC